MSNSIHEVAAKGFEVAGDAYEKGRPDYPAEAIQYLVKELGISAGKTVVDLGAGTGKFTKLIVPAGAKITAIEPVSGMRKKFSEVLPQVSVLEGAAEKIPLDSDSVDAVIVAQAFHWFDGDKALTEIHRVLKPGGKLGLIWNVRDESVDWIAKLTEIVDPHEKGAPRYKYGNWKKAFAKTKLFSLLQESHFNYLHKGDQNMVVERIASISFISALDQDMKNQVLDKVRTLLKNHPQTKDKKELSFPYRTDLFVCTKLS